MLIKRLTVKPNQDGSVNIMIEAQNESYYPCLAVIRNSARDAAGKHIEACLQEFEKGSGRVELQAAPGTDPAEVLRLWSIKPQVVQDVH
jgi:hypothetical protein